LRVGIKEKTQKYKKMQKAANSRRSTTALLHALLRNQGLNKLQNTQQRHFQTRLARLFNNDNWKTNNNEFKDMYPVMPQERMTAKSAPNNNASSSITMYRVGTNSDDVVAKEPQFWKEICILFAATCATLLACT